MSRFETELQTLFPNQNIEYISSGDSEVYRVGDYCVKIFPDTCTFSYYTLIKYQYVTNTISNAISGHTIYVPLNDSQIEFTLDVVPIDGIFQFSQEKLFYTYSRFVEGPNLEKKEELHSNSSWQSIFEFYKTNYLTNIEIIRAIFYEINKFSPNLAPIIGNELCEMNIKLNGNALSITDLMGQISLLNDPIYESYIKW